MLLSEVVACGDDPKVKRRAVNNASGKHASA